jgi:hypothetical protein
MKSIRHVGLLCVIGLLPLSLTASESEDAVLAVLKPVADAAMRGDFSAGIQVMYEPLAQELGGKPRLIASAALLKGQMEAEGLKLVRQEFVKPFRFVQGTTRRYVIVPTLTEIQTPKNLIRARSYQLGIEVSPGTWQFVDGSNVTGQVLDKYFADFPGREKLPETKRETAPLPIGAR